MTDDYTINTEETRIRAARQTGRLTFQEIADQQGVQAATDLMLRVVRMTPLLEEVDVRNWRKAYEELQEIDARGNTNGVDFEREQTSESSFQIVTPSFRGRANRIRPDAVRWEVFERDTNWNLGRGEAGSESEAIDQMTKVIAASI